MPDDRSEFWMSFGASVGWSDDGDHDAFVGKSLRDGRYEVRGIIGEGGFGVVYHCSDIGPRPHTRLRAKNATDVAVKRFKKGRTFLFSATP